MPCDVCSVDILGGLNCCGLEVLAAEKGCGLLGRQGAESDRKDSAAVDNVVEGWGCMEPVLLVRVVRVAQNECD